MANTEGIGAFCVGRTDLSCCVARRWLLSAVRPVHERKFPAHADRRSVRCRHVCRILWHRQTRVFHAFASFRTTSDLAHLLAMIVGKEGSDDGGAITVILGVLHTCYLHRTPRHVIVGHGSNMRCWRSVQCTGCWSHRVRVCYCCWQLTSAEFSSNSCRLPYAELIVMRDAPDTAAVLQRLQHV